MEKNLTIILAGGSGIRFGNTEPKQFAQLGHKSVIEHTLDRFEYHPDIHTIYVVSHPNYVRKTEEIVRKTGYKKVDKILSGGKTRQISARIGLEAIDKNFENILIHDAVRPLVGKEIIDKILRQMGTCQAVTVVIPSSDTIVEIGKQNRIINIPKRHFLRMVQTPQAFKLKLILEAHRLGKDKNMENASDDCGLVFHFGLTDIFVIDGSLENIKITYPNDIHVAEEIIKSKKTDLW